MQEDPAGDPMGEQKWVRSSLRHLSERLKAAGHPASPPTVGRLLRKLGYSLRVNAKKREGSFAHPDRASQFEVIASQRQVFQAAGSPIISVDTKKKELIGNAQECWASLGSGSRDGECCMTFHTMPSCEPFPMGSMMSATIVARSMWGPPPIRQGLPSLLWPVGGKMRGEHASRMPTNS